MSSILTNIGAMVALNTLRETNANLQKSQSNIATGKHIATAKDNAAIWAIAKTMEADVASFKELNSAIALGKSTVTVARTAVESSVKFLTDIKSKIIQANKPGISDDERVKLQTDITAMRDQIKSTVSSAQFNGQNLLNGVSVEPVSVLAALSRDIDSVQPGYVSVKTADMRGTVVTGMPGYADKTILSASTTLGNVTGAADVASATVAAGASSAAATLNFAAAAATGAQTMAATNEIVTRDGTTSGTTPNPNGLFAGDQIKVTIGTATLSHTFAAGETRQDMLDNLNKQLELLKGTPMEGVTLALNGGTGQLTVVNGTTAAVTVATDIGRATAVTSAVGTLRLADIDGTDQPLTVTPAAKPLGNDNANAAGIVAGDLMTMEIDNRVYSYTVKVNDKLSDIAMGLTKAVQTDRNDAMLMVTANDTTGALTVSHFGTAAKVEGVGISAHRGQMAALEAYDVMTAEGAESFLGVIDQVLTNAINSAAAFGSSEKRLEVQAEFTIQVTNALKTGIGSLVDADMEEEAARLQALQVQQQLGTQALSIANQSAQSIMALFR